MCPPAVGSAALQWCVTPGKDDVIVSSPQKHHAEGRAVVDELESQDLGVELTTERKIADRDAEVDDTLGFNHKDFYRAGQAGS